MLNEEDLDTDLEDEDLEYVPGVHAKGKQSYESHEMVSRANSVE
jgi:hypothetical protein